MNNDNCSKYFTFSDFVECSDTYKRVLCENEPKQPETYLAIKELACNVLDKVQEEFGSLKLTYGFCSSTLDKYIKKNNSPKLDQHAGHELNSKGQPICERLGFAADFIVPSFSSLDVARYIVSSLKFDRLYYYGCERPLHVSLNKNPISQIYLMKTYDNRRVPLKISEERFLEKDPGF